MGEDKSAEEMFNAQFKFGFGDLVLPKGFRDIFPNRKDYYIGDKLIPYTIVSRDLNQCPAGGLQKVYHVRSGLTLGPPTSMLEHELMLYVSSPQPLPSTKN